MSCMYVYMYVCRCSYWTCECCWKAVCLASLVCCRISICRCRRTSTWRGGRGVIRRRSAASWRTFSDENTELLILWVHTSHTQFVCLYDCVQLILSHCNEIHLTWWDRWDDVSHLNAPSCLSVDCRVSCVSSSHNVTMMLDETLQSERRSVQLQDL